MSLDIVSEVLFATANGHSSKVNNTSLIGVILYTFKTSSHILQDMLQCYTTQIHHKTEH